jgi:dihydropyrimidinase
MNGEATTLIRGGTVVMGDHVAQADLLIAGERIAAVGALGDVAAAHTVDAGGLLVLPGGVDTHVHMNDVFMNTVSVHDYYTGTLAAAHGGTTSMIDFSNQLPGHDLMSTLSQKHEEAQGLALIDWGVHPTITDPSDATLAQIKDVVAAGAPTIKCYMTYREDGLLMEEPDLRRILTALRDAGGMMLVHAEDNDLIEQNIPRLLAQGKTAAPFHSAAKPPEVENRALESCVRLAQETGGRIFVVHLTNQQGMEMVAQARAQGIDILAETCTHYLIFTEAMLERPDGIKWVLSPPLRSQRHQDALWQGLADGRLCQVTSDDAAYSWAAKQMGAARFDLVPNGIPGIEPRFQLLYSEGVAKGRISLARFAEIVAGAPARLFGMAHKGSLHPGKDADIVLLDPTVAWTLEQSTSHMATDWPAYDQIPVTGKITHVYSRGELIVERGKLLAEKGRGRYIWRGLG